MLGVARFAGRRKTYRFINIQSRSKLGHDSPENLITLCASCHAALHGNRKESRLVGEVENFRQLYRPTKCRTWAQ